MLEMNVGYENNESMILKRVKQYKMAKVSYDQSS
jgi:hypothetical protein